MTPIESLIYWAEELADAVDHPIGTNVSHAQNNLRAAISSAKAVEEGVETTFLVECDRGGLTETWMRETIEDGHACYLAVAKDYPKSEAVRLIRKDDYSTVIEVREKEGLRD